MPNKRRKIKFEVTVTVPVGHGTTITQWREYIKEAVESWGGQYHSDDDLFPQNWYSDNVTVKRIKDERTNN